MEIKCDFLYKYFTYYGKFEVLQVKKKSQVRVLQKLKWGTLISQKMCDLETSF